MQRDVSFREPIDDFVFGHYARFGFRSKPFNDRGIIEFGGFSGSSKNLFLAETQYFAFQ